MFLFEMYWCELNVWNSVLITFEINSFKRQSCQGHPNKLCDEMAESLLLNSSKKSHWGRSLTWNYHQLPVNKKPFLSTFCSHKNSFPDLFWIQHYYCSWNRNKSESLNSTPTLYDYFRWNLYKNSKWIKIDYSLELVSFVNK